MCLWFFIKICLDGRSFFCRNFIGVFSLVDSFQILILKNGLFFVLFWVQFFVNYCGLFSCFLCIVLRLLGIRGFFAPLFLDFTNTCFCDTTFSPSVSFFVPLCLCIIYILIGLFLLFVVNLRIISSIFLGIFFSTFNLRTLPFFWFCLFCMVFFKSLTNRLVSHIFLCCLIFL